LAWVRLEGVVHELYDGAFLPGVRAPAAIGFNTDEITRLISIDEC
jgi:protein O-GlcNAc transferase